VGLEQAQKWADRAVTMDRNFTSLRAQALVTETRGDKAAAAALRAEALALATEPDLNNYGYELLQAGKAAEAVDVFRRNLAKHPDSWNAHDSLGEGLAASGDKAGAIEEYRKARAMVKDDTNQKRIDGILAGLGGTE
jgi:Flp pilus assembly protein TadD